MFADDYQQMFGKTLSVTQGKATPGDFILSLSADKKLGEEGYEIKITDRITTSAPTPTGLYWSTRTLLQIAEQSQEHSFPKGIIRDYPDYSIRGFMIDCGRKFIPMSYLQDLVKIMAYYKMNTLQVHLNDNGFKQYFDTTGTRLMLLSVWSPKLIRDSQPATVLILKKNLLIFRNKLQPTL